MAALIVYLFGKHHGSYGSPRITANLRDLGWRVSKNTVATLMGDQGLVARKKRRRRSLTKADRSARKAPDALHDAELARAALCVAIAIRGGSVAGVLFHTDQGGEYTGECFAEACRRTGITQSMGRTGSAQRRRGVVQFHPRVRAAARLPLHHPGAGPAGGGRLDR